MAAMVPALLLTVPNQAQIGLVNQSRGLQRLARRLVGQLVRSQAAQLVVDQRQQLASGVRIALLNTHRIWVTSGIGFQNTLRAGRLQTRTGLLGTVVPYFPLPSETAEKRTTDGTDNTDKDKAPGGRAAKMAKGYPKISSENIP